LTIAITDVMSVMVTSASTMDTGIPKADKRHPASTSSRVLLAYCIATEGFRLINGRPYNLDANDSSARVPFPD
jgi:hypothetical protein